MGFLKDITIGQYVPGESPVHRLDPRIKIAIIAAIIIEIFLIVKPLGFFIITLIFLAASAASGIWIGYILKGIKPILFLILITLFFNFFFSTGTVIWQYRMEFLGGFTLKITKEGISTGLLMSARLILLVFATSLLTLTTSPIKLTDALESLLKPFKELGFPSHELAMMLSIALRFIPVLLEETERIYKAQKSRGASFGTGGLINRAKSFLPLLIPLFVHAFKHAEDLAAAMESRCYRGEEGRTRLKKLEITKFDITAASAVAAILILVSWWDVYGSL